MILGYLVGVLGADQAKLIFKFGATQSYPSFALCRTKWNIKCYYCFSIYADKSILYKDNSIVFPFRSAIESLTGQFYLAQDQIMEQRGYKFSTRAKDPRAQINKRESTGGAYYRNIRSLNRHVFIFEIDLLKKNLDFLLYIFLGFFFL